ncbi:MAG TPA: hypothetical protein VIL09_16645 [Microvirga sp.]|jgi:hypothetical protein
MSLTLQPVRVATGFDEEGVLVLDDEQRLVAVLTRLDGQYGAVSGHWFLEAGFGRLSGRDQPTFVDLEAATDWVRQRLAKAQ